jgi:hypothetical protein
MFQPTFTSTTTAEEVADIFANEIKGKNGERLRVGMVFMNLSKTQC